jgi:hypothetical protein
MSRNRVVTFLLLAVIVYGVYWFATRFERVTERERVGYQGEARENPLLAAGMLVQRLGLPARRITGVNQVYATPTDGVLVLADRRSMTPLLAARLIAWAERGGHVITSVERSRDADPLLDALDIEREWSKENPQTVFDVRLAENGPPLRVRLAAGTSRMRFVERIPRAEIALRDKSGKAYFLHTRVGDGAITLVPDLSFAANGEICNLDHAEAFWQLVNLQPDRHSLWTAARLEAPSLARWLRENAQAAIGAAIFLLLFWLWRIVPRFGPVAPDPAPARRRLLDHLRAAGRFHWDREGSLGLLGAARDACLRRLARVHPDLALLAPGERAREAAARTGLGLAEARQAFELPAVDAREFTASVRAVQIFEERLNRRA